MKAHKTLQNKNILTHSIEDVIHVHYIYNVPFSTPTHPLVTYVGEKKYYYLRIVYQQSRIKHTDSFKQYTSALFCCCSVPYALAEYNKNKYM